MPESVKCLIRKHQLLNFWGKTIKGNYGKRAESKWERKEWNRWNHVRKREVTLNGYICAQDGGGWKTGHKIHTY